ncbi:MAG: sigma factor-like helix-turn-helix DNA-binding protein [Tissierellaceae bacterium]|nr:sigma factor-like helix-turn-helix DNA-binding protein [Tissierellaceae bacterium]
MVEKKDLISIFNMRFIDNLTQKEIANALGIHRNTVSRYVSIMRENLSTLKEDLIKEGTCSIEDFNNFLKFNKNRYIDVIISFDCSRKKRKLTPEIMTGISMLIKKINTSKTIEVYYYIQDNFPDNPLSELSYSSIWRALKEIDTNN